ncbi:MAG TPA: hypothetical protein VL309_07055 [Vicinamibacterales bacterium]|jgi:hypothetical protein|nr:hypothetical protein [Vicinamibacterales bacterium]
MIAHDLRSAWRLRQRQGFTVVAVLTIGLGIGTNVTILSWAEALLFHPIKGATGADRLLVVNGTNGAAAADPLFALRRD